MAAYLIALAKVSNPTRLPEYSAAAVPTLIAAGGEVVTRGKLQSLAGSFSADACLIVKFADTQAARNWYQSADYQALIPLRDEVMEPNFLLLEEPPG
jgi:uncharacterized protein (DUF1330 family)